MMRKAKSPFKYIWRFVLLSVLFFFSEFGFILSSVDISNYKDSLDMYQRAGLEGGLYFTASGGFESPFGEPDIAELEALPAVEGVVYLNYDHFYTPIENDTMYYNVFVYPDSALQTFQFSVSDGIWLSDFPDVSSENGSLNAIVCGDTFRDKKVGDTINALELGSDEDIKIKVLGKLPEGIVLPHFKSSGNGNSTDQLFEIGNYSSNYILAREQDFARFQKLHSEFSGLGCVIRLKPDAGNDELHETMDRIFQMGRYCKFEDILAQGRENLQKLMKSQLVIPAALLIISALDYFALLLAFFAKKASEVQCYHLDMPESKGKLRKQIKWALFPIVLPSALSLVFAFRLVPVITDFTLYILFDDPEKRVWHTAAIMLLSYFVACLAAAALIIFMQSKRMDARDLEKDK